MQVLKIFEKIAAIPHCSGDTSKLQEFITDFAKRSGFIVETDKAGNILCYKTKRDVCLQSHYDMVCVGESPKIELVYKNGYVMAKNSSLGADNGIGVAIMLALMQEGKEAEYLFTNDEEIGLVGAQHLSLSLQAQKMVNLDSEEFGTIYVGCAGGGDIVATKDIDFIQSEKKYFYKITSQNFPGGHSGVDIDKDIPSAIKEFVFFAKGADIGWIKAGERRNSIPVSLEAKVASDKELIGNEHFVVKRCEPFEVIDCDLVKFLCAFGDGVRGWEREFDIPKRSVNLARIFIEEKKLHIELSFRGNSQEDLERIKRELLCFLEGFDVDIIGEYPAWEPKVTPLAKTFQTLYKKYEKNAQFKAIHAGLECAVFAQKFPYMQIISIGVDIQNPHSVGERVRIDTIAPLYSMLKEYL